FLYKFGYDYASTHVHPMANDGEEDFLRVTGLAGDPDIDQRVLLHNSILIQLLLIQQGLNASELQWRALVYDFLDHGVEFLESGSKRYGLTVFKIVGQGPIFNGVN
ncbi:MAG TPA: hypothetical protein VF707_19675, partial [Ardenticatenaceae bacterium]